jgi:hypothetical protein
MCRFRLYVENLKFSYRGLIALNNWLSFKWLQLICKLLRDLELYQFLFCFRFFNKLDDDSVVGCFIDQSLWFGNYLWKKWLNVLFMIVGLSKGSSVLSEAHMSGTTALVTGYWWSSQSDWVVLCQWLWWRFCLLNYTWCSCFHRAIFVVIVVCKAFWGPAYLWRQCVQTCPTSFRRLGHGSEQNKIHESSRCGDGSELRASTLFLISNHKSGSSLEILMWCLSDTQVIYAAKTDNIPTFQRLAFAPYFLRALLFPNKRKKLNK